ncbi:TauD/TfdA dioxygenase family protein [Carboxylicivirga sp. N1Y90]|uniref:TauD/TfdA dioxygenase family protein n=1 Tax=Carboxylicivirga fragile TaxID=3417571 RepID=UPI003D331D8C|nr:TauD/TfdA family dioxygenase [Marinilabiliaceae bacterium N1Y90]
MRIKTNNTIGIKLNIDTSKSISKTQFDEIQKLLFKYKVVVIKKQQLTDEELLRFAHKFGTVFDANKAQVLGSKDGKTSEVVVVGNNAPEYEEAFLGHQEVLPHSDHQWVEEPSSISMLYAIDVSEGSAPTKWTDTTAVYNSLSDKLKIEISNKRIVTFNPFYRPFGEVSAKYVNRIEDIPPGEQVSHPLVRTHPYTKEKILYMHRAYEMEFENEPFKSGVKLWNTLNDCIDNSKFVYEHYWEKGDLVIWDNRATLHYRKPFDSHIRRVLKRVSIAGEKPF